MTSSPGMSARATSSDQRSPCDKLAASSILSGGSRRGSSFLKLPRNLGVDENGDAAAQRFGSQRALRRIRIYLDGVRERPMIRPLSIVISWSERCQYETSAEPPPRGNRHAPNAYLEIDARLFGLQLNHLIVNPMVHAF